MKRILLIFISLAAYAQWVDFTDKTASSNLIDAMNSKPVLSSGAGAPGGSCTAPASGAVRDFFIDTTGPDLYWCDSTNHWTLVANTGSVCALSGCTFTGTIQGSGWSITAGGAASFNTLTTAGNFAVGGSHQAASGVTNPASGSDILVFDSANSDHLARKDSSGTVHDLEKGFYPALSGTGNGFACLDSTGQLYRSAVVCN